MQAAPIDLNIIGNGWDRKRFPSILSNAVFQFLCRTESDFLAGLDFDLFTRSRVAANTCGTLPDLKNAKATDADTDAFFEVPDEVIRHIVEQCLGLFFGQAVGFGEDNTDLLQGDGSSICCRRSCSGF